MPYGPFALDGILPIGPSPLASMLLAMRTANTLRDTAGDLPSGLAADADLTTIAYPRAVEAFACAWDIAERHARRVGQKNVPLAERKTIKEVGGHDADR